MTGQALRLPRTLRLDRSDTFVFERAAEPGEWAVTGSLLFDGVELDALPPKMRAAFRSGFLGIGSFGFATLVEVAEIGADEREALVRHLADALVARFGAPGDAEALRAARDEIDFAASLCSHPPGTVIALRRTVERGAIREQFRTLRPREGGTPGADRLHAFARAFEFVETDEPEERVDLIGLRDGT
ncbi:MAG TPA: DUF6505 family protein [Microvirga sp.]|nr:DUF6505 family protein [Microvirga sp.]